MTLKEEFGNHIEFAIVDGHVVGIGDAKRNKFIVHR
jgi:hypothetical protein